MVKKLFLIACVVFLVGAVWISNGTAQQQEELTYDDGGDEGFGVVGPLGNVAAVVFTPNQYPATLKQVRLFIDTPSTFRLHIYSVANINAGPSLDTIPALVQLPTVRGWHTVDLSIYNITLNSGQHFAIGFEWLLGFDPLLLADESPPIDNRSWLWDGLNWNPIGQVIAGFNADLMIRATVEYPPVVSSTTTTEEPGGICRVCPILCGLGADSEETALLRTFRDEVLSETAEGREIIKLYYQWGPLVARAMEADEEFKEDVTEIIKEILPIVGESVEYILLLKSITMHEPLRCNPEVLFLPLYP